MAQVDNVVGNDNSDIGGSGSSRGGGRVASWREPFPGTKEHQVQQVPQNMPSQGQLWPELLQEKMRECWHGQSKLWEMRA